MQVRKRVGGQLPETARRYGVDEQIGETAFERREHKPIAVGRPARVVDFAKCVERDLHSLVGVRHVDEYQRGVAAAQRGDREPIARRIPRARRMDVLQAVVMRVGPHAHDLLDDRAGLGVGHEQIQ